MEGASTVGLRYRARVSRFEGFDHRQRRLVTVTNRGFHQRMPRSVLLPFPAPNYAFPMKTSRA
jgi:hypothetical protein